MDDRPHTASPHARRPARFTAWLAVAAAVAGVVVATHLLPEHPFASRSASWFAAAAACAAVGLLLQRHHRVAARVALLAGVAFASTGWTVARTIDTPPDRLDRLLAPAGPTAPTAPADPIAPAALVRLEGRVLTAPAAAVFEDGRLDAALPMPARTGFDLRVRTLLADAGPRTASGIVTVRTAGGPPDVSPGDLVRLTGLYTPPRAPTRPGQPDRRGYEAMEGRVGSVALPSPDLVERTVADSASSPRLLAGARARIDAAIRPPGREPTPGHALLAALVLGDTESAELTETRDAFRVSGAAHLLAISGFHLALLAAGLLIAMRLPGDFGRADTIIVAAVVLAYALLLPAKTPIVRAAVMLLALLLADLRGRRADRMTVLGWVTVCLIVWRPLDVYALGAQLSVGITALLVWLGAHRPAWLVGPPRLTRVETPRGPWWEGPWRVVRTAALTAFAAWLVAAPAIAWHTGSFSPLAPLAVLVLTPPVMVLLGLGFLAAVLSLASPVLGAAVGEGAAFVAEGVAWLARITASVPFSSVAVPPLSIVWAVAATVAAVHLCRCARLVSFAAWGPVVGAVLWALVESHLAVRTRPGVVVRVDAIAVGDGTCIVVRSRGQTLLWDCGSLTPGLGVRAIPRALRALGVDRIDAAIVTHANADHYVFIPDVSDAVGVDRVLVSASTRAALAESATGSELFGLLEADGVPVEVIQPGASLAFGSASGVFLWPTSTDAVRGLGQNDRSSVLRLDVPTAAGERRVLLTGDIQRAAAIALLQTPQAIDVDILELPHHGGWHNAAWAFVEAASPVVVLQSTGARRARASRSDERWGPVRAAIEGAGVWWVTAETGSAWVEVLEDGSVRTGAVRAETVR